MSATATGMGAVRTTQLAAAFAFAAFAAQPGQAVKPGDERPYYLFETFQTCAMDLSPAGRGLAVANTPNNRVEFYSLDGDGIPQRTATVKVGLEPSCVKWRSSSELWVVNHLSDSVSIVRLSDSAPPRVVGSLDVGDMPYSIAFGGPDDRYAFVPAKRRDILEKDYGSVTGALDVWVFDTTQSTNEPAAVLNYFAEGGVQVVAGRGQVDDQLFVMPLRSGNRSTIAPAELVNGDLPPPVTNAAGEPGPPVGLVARPDGRGVYRDGAGRDVSRYIDVEVTDNDLCAIDASVSPPVEGSCVPGVGTILYAAAVARDGTVYVANTAADNTRRFEGKGEFAGSTVAGRHHLNFITAVGADGSVTRTWVNPHLDFEAADYTAADREQSLALLTDVVLSPDDQTLYAAAYGSRRIGVFATADLDAGEVEPGDVAHIELSGGGPNSLVYDEGRNRLYAITRFDNSIVTIDLEAQREIASTPMFNPEPSYIVEGRPFLYDARLTSGPGNVACASCHVFGDTDDLSWDLGDPDKDIEPNLNLFAFRDEDVDIDFHPMKGPMFTQTLKGMRHHGPMHWRGDKNGAAEGAAPRDEKAAFEQFIGAFEGVLARRAPISDSNMALFADFVLDLVLEPNAYRPVDGELTPAQSRGRELYFTAPSALGTGFTCNDCHVLDPRRGFFGTSGLSATRRFRPDSPALKVAQIALIPDKLSAPESVPLKFPSGVNYRGFFMNHEGSTMTLFAFLQSAFEFDNGDADRRDLIEFLVATPRSIENTVGRQITVNAANAQNAATLQLLDVLEARALETEPVRVCDLTVSGTVNGEARGFLYLAASDTYLSDRLSDGTYRREDLLTIASQAGQELSFLCVPPGAGVRIAIDADLDGRYDRDELDAGTDPEDGASVPGGRITAR